MVAQKCPEHQPPKSGWKLEGHHLLPWKKTGQMMDAVQVEEPKVNILCVGKGDLSLEPSLSAQKLMTDSSDGSSSPVFTTCKASR